MNEIEIRIFPNNQMLEFKTEEELREYLHELRGSERKGRYDFRNFKSVKNISPGSVALFRFADKIVGWGEIEESAVNEPFDEPGSGGHYGGYITFKPETIRAFKEPLSIAKLEDITEGMLFHFKNNYNTGRAYYKIPIEFRQAIKSRVEEI